MDYLENKACMEDQFSWPSRPLAECKLTFENHALRANTTEIADLWHSHPLACSSHLVIIERLHENKRRERCLMRRRGQKNTSYRFLETNLVQFSLAVPHSLSNWMLGTDYSFVRSLESPFTGQKIKLCFSQFNSNIQHLSRTDSDLFH